MNQFQNQCLGCSKADVSATFISSAAQLLQYAVAGLCCPNTLKREIVRDITNIIALIACLLTVMSERRNGKNNGALPARFVVCKCFALWTRKPTNSRCGLASAGVHLAPYVAVSIMHSDPFELKGLLCLCKPYACVASARVTYQTHLLQACLTQIKTSQTLGAGVELATQPMQLWGRPDS